MSKIKIAYIIDTIESPTAGTEKQILLLIKRLDRNKFEPYLCCLRSSEWLENNFDLCPLHVVGIASFKKIVSYFRILAFSRFLKRGKFDIIQTHFRDSNIVGILAARLAGIYTVISTRRGVRYWRNRFELLLLKKLNRWVTIFVTNSYSTKEWVTKIEGIPEEKIKVIYNGIDLTSFKGITDETRIKYRQLLGIPEDAPVVGIVANLRPVKGIDIFLRAAQLVKKQIPEARFVIVGDGVEKDPLVRLSNALGLNEGVTFLGQREDVVQILSALDVGVLSSHSESFSNSLIEYLAAGLPVACTDVGGCREAIEGDGRGMVVPVEDHKALGSSIVSLLARRGTCPSLVPSEWVRRTCDLPKVLGQTEELYASLTRA